MTSNPIQRCLHLLLTALLVPSAALADIYFTYTVETDRTVYRVGDTVHWKITAAIEGQTRGIGGFFIDLYESMNKEMDSPYLDFIWSPGDNFFHPTYVAEEYFTDGRSILDFNIYNGFDASYASGGAGLIAGIGVTQFEQVLDQTGGVVCEGMYTVTKPGFHYLEVVHNSGYIWLDEQDYAEEISLWDSSVSTIYVLSDNEISIADINQDNIVNFKDFTSLSNYWLASDCSDENYWCNGADINQDSFVDFLDLTQLSNDWLWEPVIP